MSYPGDESMRAVVICFLLGLSAVASAATPPKLPIVSPAEVKLDESKLRALVPIVERGLANKQMPGCVVLVARHGKIAWLQAYGSKSDTQKMTVDTVFDLASLTKPMATATSVMTLVDQEKIALDQPVAKYLPEFAASGKDRITVEHLLTHQGGLIADNPLADYQSGAEEAWKRLFALKPIAPPGERVIYSDVGFEVLGKLVEQVSEQSLHEFTHDTLFAPLGMTETGFVPAEELRARAAPTQKRDGRWLQGEVHDPRAHLLGGVAGHAGLFSTAQDVAVYAQMILNRGAYAGRRVLSAEAVEKMLLARKVPGDQQRALGWDVRSRYSSNRGQGLSDRAVGHGGFTGTVLWIDPELDLFYVFLSNRVYPDGSGNVNKLAGEIGTIVAAAAKGAP